jgi:hypothetical protein
MTLPTTESTGALALDISRFTDICARMNNRPHSQPTVAMKREGIMKMGEKNTIALWCVIMESYRLFRYNERRWRGIRTYDDVNQPIEISSKLTINSGNVLS